MLLRSKKTFIYLKNVFSKIHLIILYILVIIITQHNNHSHRLTLQNVSEIVILASKAIKKITADHL